MNSDLTTTDNVLETRNPQSPGKSVAGPQASDFQPTAGSEILTQKRQIRIETSGEPVDAPPAPKPMPVTPFFGLAIALFILGIVLYIKWRSKLIQNKVKEEAPIVTPAVKKKKKQPRSKRNQAKKS